MACPSLETRSLDTCFYNICTSRCIKRFSTCRAQCAILPCAKFIVTHQTLRTRRSIDWVAYFHDYLCPDPMQYSLFIATYLEFNAADQSLTFSYCCVAFSSSSPIDISPATLRICIYTCSSNKLDSFDFDAVYFQLVV